MSSERVAQIIAEKKEKERKAKSRRELEQKLDAVRDALESEREAKEQLLDQAAKTRHRLEVITKMAGGLAEDKQRFEDFAAHKVLRQKDVVLPGKSFLQQSHVDGPGGALPHVGRSSKRTAFTRDYRNQFYLGVREQDAKEQQIARVQSVMSLRASSSLLPAASPSLSESALSNAPSPLRFGQGVLSAPDIAEFQKRSCRRTRWYTDYEGRRFLMDSKDMPSTSGVAL